MTQGDLFSGQSERPKKRIRVRETSIAGYIEGREHFTGRKAEVLRWLAGYWNRWLMAPTSAELSQWAKPDEWANPETRLALLLHTRRGLSDLQTAGVVEAAGKRGCRMNRHRVAMTWKVKSR